MAENEPNVDKLAAVTDLLSNKPASPGTGDDAGSPGTGDGSPTGDQAGQPGPQSGDQQGTDDLTPTDLAEKLGITPQALFKSLKIPIDGGDPLTLEEFKAAGQQLRSVTDAQGDLEEKRIAFENETMVQRQLLQDMLAQIPPDQLTDELVANVQVERQQYVDTERQALLTVRPDLKDGAKWSSVRQLLVDHLAPYGFRSIEIDSVVDHRLAKYLIDNAEREVRVRELAASAEKGAQPLAGKRPPPAEKGRPKRQQQPTGRRRGPKIKPDAGGTADKVAQVASLLGEQ